MRIGIVSDTHAGQPLDDFGPEPAEFLTSVDLIIHTGDFTSSVVMDWIERLGPPALMIRGNHDNVVDDRLKDVILTEHHGWRIGITHIALDSRGRPDRIRRLKNQAYGSDELDILIAGDTHYERLEYEDGTLLVNSGSLTLPHNLTARLGGVALLEISPQTVHAKVFPIGETPDRRNPVVPAEVQISRDGVMHASYAGEALEVLDGTLRWPDLSAPPDQM